MERLLHRKLVVLMILTDGVHLVSDCSIPELHIFAHSIGLKITWYQQHRIPHYDLTTRRMRMRAWFAGASCVHTRELVKRAVRLEG